MKKMRILSILLATMLTISVFSGCTDSNTDVNHATAIEIAGTPAPTRGEDLSDQFFPDYNPTTEDLELSTRIFTELGFSVATTNTSDTFNMLFTKGRSRPFSFESYIRTELTNLLDEEYFIQTTFGEVDVDKVRSSELVAQYIMTQLGILSVAQPDVLVYEDIPSFLQNNIEIVEEEFDVFGGNQTIIGYDVNYETSGYTILKATIKINSGGNKTIAEYFPNTYEIYNLPYKTDLSKRFDVVYLQANDESLAEQRLEEVYFIADTFILDEDAVLANAQGKSKFASCSFTSYLNQDYFTNEVLIPYSRTSSFEDYDITDSLELAFTDDNLKNNADISVLFIDYFDIDNIDEYETLDVNSNTFDVLTKQVDVKADDGSISKQDLILSVIHSSEDLGDFKTYIQLNSNDFDTFDVLSNVYSQSDFDMINEVFNDIMDNYEVKLNKSSQNYMDMINEMNAID